MTNILEAIVNIAQNPIYTIRNLYSGRNRVNNHWGSIGNFCERCFCKHYSD